MGRVGSVLVVRSVPTDERASIQGMYDVEKGDQAAMEDGGDQRGK